MKKRFFMATNRFFTAKKRFLITKNHVFAPAKRFFIVKKYFFATVKRFFAAAKYLLAALKVACGEACRESSCRNPQLQRCQNSFQCRIYRVKVSYFL